MSQFQLTWNCIFVNHILTHEIWNCRKANEPESTIIVYLKYVLENYKRKGFTEYTVLGDGQLWSA